MYSSWRQSPLGMASVVGDQTWKGLDDRKQCKSARRGIRTIGQFNVWLSEHKCGMKLKGGEGKALIAKPSVSMWPPSNARSVCVPARMKGRLPVCQ